MTSPVTIIEVGPRDGLQNEPQPVPTHVKRELIERLIQAGLRHIEATAFVSPAWVPQMADHAALMQMLPRPADVTYTALTPNLKGFDAALASGLKEVAVFAAASESFSQRNINCSIRESIARFTPILAKAQAENVRVRGYVSCVIACPYEGSISPLAATDVAQQLLDLGCAEVSLGDTIGVGTPGTVRALLDVITQHIPVDRLAGHFHDTYGMAAANVLAAYDHGLRTFDSAVAGLGGCPYAPGAAGNLATEDLVYLLEGLGARTGIDLDALVATSCWISEQLGRRPHSRVAQARAPRSVSAPA